MRAALDAVTELLAARVATGDDLARDFGAWLGVCEPAPHEPDAGGLWSPRLVASTGLREARGIQTARPFANGLQWLRGRHYFLPHQPSAFESDPLAILSVAVGAREAGASEVLPWLASFISEALRGEIDEFRVGVLRGALTVASGLAFEHVPAALRVALAAQGIGEADDAALDAAWKQSMTLTEPVDALQAAIRLACLRHVVARAGGINVRAPSISDVAQILRAVPASLKRWPWEASAKTTKSTVQRWDLQNEYHVQALLWTILRPFAPDLLDEEHLPARGYKHPRADLCIPAMRLIVEVKFLRSATQSALADIQEEISADAGIYLGNNSGYDKMIAFVWDHIGASQNHAVLEAGMKSISGVVDAICVSRPGDWK